MESFQPSAFVFSSKYRVARHLLFWVLQTLLTALAWSGVSKTFPLVVLFQCIWSPIYLLFCYPFMYYVIPKFLLKEKYVQFAAMVLLWLVAGVLLNYYFRLYVFIPLREAIGVTKVNRNPGQQGTLFTLIAVWCFSSTVVLFKHWFKKQQEWMQAQKDKVTAELQLLKAQVHPHFLFNTLNNIYSFSLTNSPKTPDLILKLSSLLSYMLYDCKAEQVLLEKEIEVMKDYVDLETERYGNKIEISWNIEGEVQDKCIAPLMLLPFLENAFKHGTSEQLEKPWLNFNLMVKQNTMRCKVANSKNEYVPFNKNGIGVENVKKRLAFLYHGKHELRINDEGDFFVISLMLELTNRKSAPVAPSNVSKQVEEKVVI